MKSFNFNYYNQHFFTVVYDDGSTPNTVKVFKYEGGEFRLVRTLEGPESFGVSAYLHQGRLYVGAPLQEKGIVYVYGVSLIGGDLSVSQNPVSIIRSYDGYCESVDVDEFGIRIYGDEDGRPIFVSKLWKNTRETGYFEWLRHYMSPTIKSGGYVSYQTSFSRFVEDEDFGEMLPEDFFWDGFCLSHEELETAYKTGRF